VSGEGTKKKPPGEKREGGDLTIPRHHRRLSKGQGGTEIWGHGQIGRVGASKKKKKRGTGMCGGPY